VQLFISYTGADAGWAEWIAWHLEAAGHQAILQAWDFRPGDNFVVMMRRALDTADRTIAVVSAAYLESVYGSDEWTAAFIHDQPETTRLLVVRVEDVPLPRLLRPWIYIDMAGMDADAAARALLGGLEAGRRKPDQPPAFPPTVLRERGPHFPGSGPVISNLPPRNPVFTGRDDLLTRLHHQLTAGGGRRSVAVVGQALYGLGGVGKTQLALEYAHRFAADYDLIWWIAAENPLNIPAALTRLAPRLNIPPTDDQEALAAAVLDALRARERWLLVFDNAEQADDLVPYQPAGGGGHILITSRNPAWRALAQAVQVDVLERDEAVRLLLRRTHDHDEASAAELAHALGDLPLALEQAAAYLEQNGMPVRSYLAAYQRRHQQLLAKGRALAYQGQVDTTWQLSIDELTRSDPAGVELLRLCAFLAPEAIPLDIFTPKVGLLPEALAAAAAADGEDGVEEAAGACYRYSLVARDDTGIRVHRLVQAIVLARLSTPDRQAYNVAVAKLLAATFPEEPDDPKRWTCCAQLLPHVLAVADHAQAIGVAEATSAVLLRRAATYLWRRGEYEPARELLERTLTLAEAAYGTGHLEVAYVLNELGVVLRDLGDLPGARAAHQRELEITEAVLGPEDPDVAVALGNLGGVLHALGDLPGARAAHQRELDITQATLGPDHPDVAVALGNLGGVLQALGDLPGARAAHQRELEITEAALGPEHPNVAVALDNLGLAYRGLGDLPAARAAHERALAISQAALGPDHPEVGITLDNLGLVHRALGDLPAARAALQRALTLREAALGPNHPEVGRILGNLGLVLRGLGDVAGSHAAHRRVLTIPSDRPGPRPSRGRRHPRGARPTAPGPGLSGHPSGGSSI
jgi:tetratricopeptide (TPR) repeat protein